jgi:hypothetical protein
MSHLSRDRILDAIEGRANADTSRHLTTCSRCRAEVSALEAALQEILSVDVPEPSPLFWEYLSSRVREAIAAEPTPRPGAARRPIAWQPAAAILALSLIAGTAVSFLSRTAPHASRLPVGSSPPRAAEPSVNSLELLSGDDWQLVMDATDAADWEAVRTREVGTPDASDLAESELSSDERRELVKLLNEELNPPVQVRRRLKGDV